ncbi:MAG: hypothetical protein JNK15_23785 [Planctomycetes bacterium]|nr:hypothetical protein [Planctomycetota bacterium]
MVTVAFGVAVAASGGTAAGLGIATYAAIAAGGLLAAYIDQTQVYPALFGKKNPRPDAIEGFQLSTTDPGAPRWQVFGTRAWVPCHYLWSLNVREEVSGNGQTGKGGRPFTQTMRADVGLALCDGPIASIDTLSANERPLWSRQFNRVVVEDHRWAITADVPNGTIRIEATDADVTDFAGIFDAGSPAVAEDGNLVRLERVSPTGLAGYYRVAGVAAHTSAARSVIAMRPLRSQPLVGGTAGSTFEPAALRRIDQGAASETWVVNGFGSSIVLRRPANDPAIPGLPNQNEQLLQKIWIVGGVYRLDGFAPSGINGLYRLASRTSYPTTVGGTGNPAQDYQLTFEPMESQPTGTATGAGTSTNPGIITRDEASGPIGTQGRGFVFADSQQEFATYPGTLDQLQDPTLAALEPSASAHRGIAHVSLKDWNLGPHGNTFPNVLGLARARSGETVAQALGRIFRRAGPEGHVDTSKLRGKVLLGYAIPGSMASGQAMQPLLVMHGIGMQDRGGVLTFLDERDFPVVSVPTRHLNARPLGEQTNSEGFIANRVDEADLPERVLMQYVDPAEGANEADGAGRRSPGSPDRGGRDTLLVNLRPLVVWGYEVKRRSREILRRARLETHRGQIRLSPGYMDVLAGHCLTFRSNNRHEEVLPASATIAHDTQLRDILPESVAVWVRFSGGQVATLVDDGAGKLEGFPAGITASVNTVNYTTGRVELLCSEALDTGHPPRLLYRYEKLWLVRANKATLAGHDFAVSCDVVKTTTDNPLPPVPRDRRPGLGGAIGSEVPAYRTAVVDVPPMVYGPRSVWFFVGASPESGSTWRGAQVYQSPNGVDRWTMAGYLQQPTPIGTVPANNLPDSLSGGTPSVIDWATELEIDLPGGEELDDATTDMIALGQNWLLIGDEIIGFHEAESAGGTLWTLRGLVRGLRQTFHAIDSHADGERVVLLTGIGGTHGLFIEPPGGAAAANRTYHLRVVPAGGSIDLVPTISQIVRGKSMLPAPPQVEQGMLTQEGSDLVLSGWRPRSLDQTTLFGPSPLQEAERYRVVAFDILTAFTLLGSMTLEQAITATAKKVWHVGGPQMGTPLARRSINYLQADMIAHGFIVGLTPVGFVVYQVGDAGLSERSDVVFATPV